MHTLVGLYAYELEGHELTHILVVFSPKVPEVHKEVQR